MPTNTIAESHDERQPLAVGMRVVAEAEVPGAARRRVVGKITRILRNPDYVEIRSDYNGGLYVFKAESVRPNEGARR